MLKLTLRNVALSAKSAKFHKTIFGDLEFLPHAISGPIALSMSSLINRLDHVELSLDLKPALEEEKLEKRLLREIEQQPRRDVAYLLSVLLPAEFVPFFVENTRTETGCPLNSFSREKRKKLLKDLKEFHLSFLGLEEIDKGIVTAGGVDTKQIDPRSFESKLCENLYFIGEVLDVDALTGGFNLQSALSMGYSCAAAIRKETRE